MKQKQFNAEQAFYRKDTFREEKGRMAHFVPWRLLRDSGLVINKNGSIQVTFSYKPPDMESSTPEELRKMALSINDIFRRLGTGWHVWMESQRRTSDGYIASGYPSTAGKLFERERREYFSDGAHFENMHFITFCYMAPSSKINNAMDTIKSFFITNTAKDVGYYRKEMSDLLEDFNKKVDTYYSMLKSCFIQCKRLDPDETATFLHSLISDKYHEVKVPDTDYPLDYYIFDADLSGQWNPRLGKNHIRIVTIRGFDNKTETGMFDELNKLGFEYRYVVRYSFMDKLDARTVLKEMQDKWDQKQKTITQMFAEAVMRQPSPKIDQTAVLNSSMIVEGLVALDSDRVGFGYSTMCIVVWDTDEDIVQAKAAAVETVINDQKFTAYIEGANGVESWFGTLPGLFYFNVRRSLIHTMNMVHQAPISGIWAGPKLNYFLNAPPLLYCDTDTNVPFRLNLHDEKGMAHTMVVGPSGAGKSVLLNLIEAHFTKYPGAKLFIFDKGASSRAVVAALGGNFYNIGLEEDQLSFQPLARIDNDNERTWAESWIVAWLEMQNFVVKSDHKTKIATALKSLSILPVESRTMFMFSKTVQDEEIRDAVGALVAGRSFGKLFDANEDRCGSGNIQAFEMETLMNTPAIVPATLDYLFHRIEAQLEYREDADKIEKGQKWPPALIILDECWVFLKNPIFAEKIREYFKTLRKRNCGIVIATQELSDIASDANFAATVINNCPTKIFLPNDHAMNETNRNLYHLFGLNDTQINIIYESRPKQDYYFSQNRQFRKIQLALQPSELAICGATGIMDQAALKDILKKYPKEEFLDRWLEYKEIDRRAT